MSSNKKNKNLLILLVLTVCSLNVKTIEKNYLTNEFSGTYISTSNKNDNANKIFDLSSLNIENSDFILYINETIQKNNSNNYI